MVVERGAREAMTVSALFPERDGQYRALAIGAHADDIEIGAGGFIMRALAERPGLTIDFVVLTGNDGRRAEAEASASGLAGGRLGTIGVRVVGLEDGRLPAAGAAPKEEIEQLKAGGPYDLVLCPSLGDAHQDHRLIAELVRQTFRSPPILEYEIPKYEGISEQPNLFVSSPATDARPRSSTCCPHFPRSSTGLVRRRDVLGHAAPPRRGVGIIDGLRRGVHRAQAADLMATLLRSARARAPRRAHR